MRQTTLINTKTNSVQQTINFNKMNKMFKCNPDQQTVNQTQLSHLADAISTGKS